MHPLTHNLTFLIILSTPKMAVNGSVNTNSIEQKFLNGNSNAAGKTYNQCLYQISQDAPNRDGTAGSINMPPELFEKLYLAPKNEVKGELRNTFGNPTPL